jgi:hypothetical protein
MRLSYQCPPYRFAHRDLRAQMVRAEQALTGRKPSESCAVQHVLACSNASGSERPPYYGGELDQATLERL